MLEWVGICLETHFLHQSVFANYNSWWTKIHEHQVDTGMSMEISKGLVSWFITYLRGLQHWVIIHLLSTMDIPVGFKNSLQIYKGFFRIKTKWCVFNQTVSSWWLVNLSPKPTVMKHLIRQGRVGFSDRPTASSTKEMAYLGGDCFSGCQPFESASGLNTRVENWKFSWKLKITKKKHGKGTSSEPNFHFCVPC